MNKRFWLWLGGLGGVLLILYAYFSYAVYVPAPEIDESLYNRVVIKNPDKNFFTYKNNWLRKSKSGLWEMYVEGKPFELGIINGKLSEKLVLKQEEHFVENLKKLLPSSFYINILKQFISWFNRDLHNNISEEYKKEIYGVSRSAAPAFDYIAPKYNRILNYHAAHDIGHLVQELHMVGCTSFAAWKEKAADSSLIVGRNFDFYVGDNFAEDKIVAFINPDSGYKFMMLTWGGMIGAVSGMNEHGLTVTINAARSDIPTNTATPISIVAREVLQYASDIQEAHKVIKSRTTFVGQTFLVASAKDNKAVVIEKTPFKTAVFSSDTNYITCSNHYQSEVLKNNKLNLLHIEETGTMSRYNRINELLQESESVNLTNSVKILRDTKGVNGKEVGLGNEKTLNQLQGHHSIIFKPSERLVWVSTSPWQMGEYIAYDLDVVFEGKSGGEGNNEINIDSLTVPEDSFVKTREFSDYLKYRQLKSEVEDLIRKEKQNDSLVEKFLQTNSKYYLVYQLSGSYYLQNKNLIRAKECFEEALARSIAWKIDSIDIVGKISEINENL